MLVQIRTDYTDHWETPDKVKEMHELMNKGVVPRYRDGAEKLNTDMDQTSRLASQAIGGLTKVQPAAEIMEDLMEE